MSDNVNNILKSSGELMLKAEADNDVKAAEIHEEQQKTRKRSLIKLAVLLIMLIAVLLFATIAWFTMNKEIQTNGMGVKVQGTPYTIMTRSESGYYNILIGKSSADICLEEQVHFNSSVRIPILFTLDNTVSDINSTAEGKKLFEDMMSTVFATANGGADQLGDSAKEMAMAIANDLPLHAMVSFTDNPDITREKLQMMLDKLNVIINSK